MPSFWLKIVFLHLEYDNLQTIHHPAFIICWWCFGGTEVVIFFKPRIGFAVITSTENKIYTKTKWLTYLENRFLLHYFFFFSLYECIRGQRNYTLREAEHLKTGPPEIGDRKEYMAPTPQHFYLPIVNWTPSIWITKYNTWVTWKILYLKFITHFKFKQYFPIRQVYPVTKNWYLSQNEIRLKSGMTNSYYVLYVYIKLFPIRSTSCSSCTLQCNGCGHGYTMYIICSTDSIVGVCDNIKSLVWFFKNVGLFGLFDRHRNVSDSSYIYSIYSQ